MDLRNASKHIGGPGRVFMTVLITLIAVTVVQLIAVETVRAFANTRRVPEMRSEPQRTDQEKKIERIARSAKQFLPDGTVHLVYGLRTEAGRPVEPRTEQIYDANDKLLWEGPSDKRPYEYLSWAEEPRNYNEVFALLQMRLTQTFAPLLAQTIEIPVGTINDTEQIWRYRPGAECFEGYAIDGQRIGYISAAGFSDSKSKVKPLGAFRLFTAWCPQDSSIPTLLWQTNRHIYQINFEKRQTKLLFESANSDIETITLHAWKDLKPGTKDYIDSKKYRPLLVCITQDGVHHLILREPDQQLSLPGPRCSVTATRQSIYALRHGSGTVPVPSIATSPELYKEWVEQYRDKPRKMWTELYKVSDDGGLELLNRYDWVMPAPGRFMQVDPMLAAQRFVTHFSPPLYSLVFRLLGREFWSNVHRSANQGDFFYTMLQTPQYLRPLNSTLNWVLSALMMGFVFWYGWPRRVSHARFIFWLVFVGLLNVTGLLTYLALNHTAVIKCPACGRRRGLAQSDCIHCQAPLPAPKARELDLIFRSCC